MDNFNSGKIKEMVYDVLQNPTRENFIDILDNGLGEQDNLDFKVQWIEAQKLAEILLGIANSGGGAIILGVKENEDGTLESIGLSKIEDKEKIHSKMAKFLPETIKFEIADFDFSNESYSKLKGRLFQLILIYSEDINLPYIWEKDSNSAEAGSIFFRRGTKTVKANSYEINEMLDKRLEATYVEQSSLHLEEHLKEIVNISGKDEETLAKRLEEHRQEVHDRIAQEHPELAERFRERRHLLDKHLRERRPEVYELVIRLREKKDQA